MRTRGLGTRRTRTTTAAALAVAVAAGCLGGTTTAANAADPCVTAFPQDDLTTGQELNGLTVSRGTTPEAFEGEVVGVLDDGIAPGVDMILAELSSPAVDANGIWAGMSGSPVYADAAQTQLVGAVSYTLNEGRTTLAGITPAADMLALSSDTANQRVALGARMTKRLAAAGTATRSELASGMRALPTPIRVSGLSDRRFRQLAGWLDDQGPVANGGAGGAAASAVAADIVPGGNIAASLGYGFVSAAATGTVTSVCDDEVLAFGHPFSYAGDSTYSLHPASAAGIVPGATFGGYKLANLGAPVGTVDGDHLAGIRGTLGATPPSFPVTSTATSGSRTVTGTTRVTVEDLVGDAALANAFAVSDRALDRYGKGTALAQWTVTGLRRDGRTPFTLTWSDVWTSSYDVASAPLSGLAMQLGALLENQTEEVTITSVTTRTTLLPDTTQWRIGRTYRWAAGSWKQVTAKNPVLLRPGTSAPVRVELFSRTAPTRYVTIPVSTTKASAGRTGRMVLQGGFMGEDEWYFYDSSEEFYDENEDEMLGGTLPESIPATLKRLQTTQKNTAVASAFTVRGSATQKRSVSLDRTVSGRVVVPVKVLRR